MIRYATVRGNGLTSAGLSRYLPANYHIVGSTVEDSNEVFVIAGQDNSGWTMNDYVIPRLASGLFWAKELVEK